MAAAWGTQKSWTSHFNASDSSIDAGEVNGHGTVAQRPVVFTERPSATKSSPLNLKPSLSSKKGLRSRGIVYGELEPVPFDPQVDPDWDLCFNCWKPGHSHKECSRPKYHDYCRNCGRQGVNWTTCPRCAKGYRDYQQWRVDNNRPEFKEREKPIISKQVANNVIPATSTSSIETRPKKVELPVGNSAPYRNEFEIVQSQFPAFNSFPPSIENNMANARLQDTELPLGNTGPLEDEYKFVQSQFPAFNSFPTVENNMTNARPQEIEHSLGNRGSFNDEYKIVQSQFPAFNSFPTFEDNMMNSRLLSYKTPSTSAENKMQQVPLLPPPIRNAARNMSMDIFNTRSKSNAMLYQQAVREIDKQSKSNSFGESVFSSEDGDYNVDDEDLDGIVVDEEEPSTDEPSTSNTVQDFMSLIDVVKHLPIDTQNKLVEQFAKERRVLMVGKEMEKLQNNFH